MGAIVADARRFADMHALYRMYDDHGKLLYVGITGDLGKRLDEHDEKRWFPLVAAIKLEWKETRAAALVAENRAIVTERPRYNKAGRKLSKTTVMREAQDEKQRSAEERRRNAETPRDLLADLDAVLGAEHVRLSALPHLLRERAPGCLLYEKLSGKQLAEMLDGEGVRWTNSKNVPTLDPADLRRVTRRIAG